MMVNITQAITALAMVDIDCSYQ